MRSSRYASCVGQMLKNAPVVRPAWRATCDQAHRMRAARPWPEDWRHGGQVVAGTRTFLGGRLVGDIALSTVVAKVSVPLIP